MDALPEVVTALDGKVPVFVDGGFRTGTDIFKALALGADMVFVGRPVIYGLAVGVCLWRLQWNGEIVPFDRGNRASSTFWVSCALNWNMQ